MWAAETARVSRQFFLPVALSMCEISVRRRLYAFNCFYSVTSVGATDGVSPETVAGFSSGGFSNLFGVPDFQKDAVQGYVNQLGEPNTYMPPSSLTGQRVGGTYSGSFNAGGRGFPDVAAQGTKIATVNKGQFGQTGGTSASAPIFASAIAFLSTCSLRPFRSFSQSIRRRAACRGEESARVAEPIPVRQPWRVYRCHRR